MLNAESAAKGRSAKRRPFRFGTRDIANAVGKSMAATRKDRQRGKFNPADLQSLAAYIVHQGEL